MPRQYDTPLQRVLANCEVLPWCGCWIWMGKATTNRSGMQYGALTVRRKSGPRKGKVRTVLAHRFAKAAALGVPICRIKIGAHLCDTSLCANPDHVAAYWTQRINMRDMVAKGRHRNGSPNGLGHHVTPM